MSNRILSLLIAFGMGLIVMFFAHRQQIIPDENYNRLKIRKQAEIDSLSLSIKQIEELRYQDSLRTVAKLLLNTKTTNRLKNDIKKISFKEYTDPQLDSIILFMYPDSLRTGELFVY